MGAPGRRTLQGAMEEVPWCGSPGGTLEISWRGSPRGVIWRWVPCRGHWRAYPGGGSMEGVPIPKVMYEGTYITILVCMCGGSHTAIQTGSYIGPYIALLMGR